VRFTVFALFEADSGYATAVRGISYTIGGDMPVTPTEFRRMALGFPETLESSHMGHPDFRVCGKIFATLSSPGEKLGMVKLSPKQQETFVQAEPAVYVPVNGAWGRRGCTHVRLKAAKKSTLRIALVAAWCNTAPKRLAAEFAASSEGRGKP